MLRRPLEITLRTLVGVADLELASGRKARAVALYTEAVKGLKVVLGEKHRITRRTQAKLDKVK